MVFANISRKQAFLTHLLSSAIVFFVISYLIIFHWFPGFYFALDGGARGIITIFLVDVVLGPSLTLLIFKPGKKGLKFDMAVILIVQFSALIWGINSVYTERPGATVFYYGKFTCITQNDTQDMNMNAIVKGPSGQQRLSFLQRPDTVDDFLDFMKEAFSHKSSAIYYHREKIVPLDKRVIKRLQNYQLNLSELAEESEESARRVEDYIGRYQGDIEKISLIPMSCRYGSAIAVYDMHDLKIIDLLDVETKLRAAALDEPLPLRLQIPDYSTPSFSSR